MTEGVFASAADLGLTFPGSTSAGNLARMGPNMIADPTRSMPEPGSLMLFGLGVSGLALLRRRNS